MVKGTSQKITKKKIALYVSGGLFSIIIIVGLFLYNNFNGLLSEALIKSFNSTMASDVYELKFKNLRVNLALGNIRVQNVILQPREKPLKEYPYINSQVTLTTKEILLTNVEITTLLTQNILELDRIKIDKPDVEITITKDIPIFLPFKDSTGLITDTTEQTMKDPIEGFFLSQFNLKNASIHLNNLAKEQDFKIKNVNITLSDFNFDQQPGRDIYSYSHFDFYIGEIMGSMQKEAIKKISLTDYELIIDSLEVEKSIDTLIYHFNDFRLGLKNLDLQTEDSIYHIALQEFELSYKEKSIKLQNVELQPNISESELQKQHQFQVTQFSGSAGLLNISGINFDSLIYRKKIFVDEIVVDSVKASIFKDKNISIDTTRFPEYLGQSIDGIAIPLLVKQVSATNVDLVNRELKPDSSYAFVHVNRGKLSIENITNINTKQPLTINADAFVENKVRAKLVMNFDYNKPQFSIKGSIPQFKLKDLEPIINSYTPVKVQEGVIDKIEFSGNSYHTGADGTMEFLYHDLKLQVEIEEKARWKSSLLSFAANTVVASSNPASENVPPRTVKYHAERDMNKGFFNIFLRSFLNGIKETVFMSKENKKTYKETKREIRKEEKQKN